MKRQTNKSVMDALLKMRQNLKVQVGWFENSKYSNGQSIGGIAAVQNYGATISHPGGTPYFINEDGQAQFVSLQNSKAGQLPKTKPHTIVIPPTHFMEKTIEAHKEDWKETVKDGFAMVFSGKESEENVMRKLGMMVEGDIAKAITEVDDPVKPSTIRQKRRRYKDTKTTGGLTKRLVASGLMLDSLSHKVEKI